MKNTFVELNRDLQRRIFIEAVLVNPGTVITNEETLKIAAL